MANEADSRHTVDTLRWGETALQVPDANVVEPSGGIKDVGWVPGVDVPVAEYFNWLSWTAGVFNRYVENSRALMWTRNHVMAGAAAGEGDISNGVGLSVDLTSARVWIAGQMQKVPAATNLALAAADPTDPRIDLVCARVTALVPNYHVVTGTPAVIPDPPAVPAGSCAMWQVNVLAAAVAPGTKTDRREFGAVDLDLVRANDKLSAGDLGSGEFMFTVDGVSDTVAIGNDTDPIMLVENFGEVLKVKAESVRFFTPITRKFDLGPGDFVDIVSSTTSLLGAIAAAVASRTGSGGSDTVVATARIPNGATITAVRAYINRVTNVETMRVRLLKSPKTTGVLAEIVNVATPSGSGATGDVTLAATGLSESVDQDDLYTVVVNWGGSGIDASLLYGAEVEYTEISPFDGL